MKAFGETVLIFLVLWTIVMLYEWWRNRQQGQ